MTRIVIIGGGPAGYEAALVAAAYGADVTLIDSDGIGGACVLWDCVPSKTFIASTGIRTEVRRAIDLGINLRTDDALVTLPQIHQRVRDLAFAQSADIRDRLLSEGVTLVSGYASLEETHPGIASHRVVATLQDGTTEHYDGDVVLIATGASPRVLPDAAKAERHRKMSEPGGAA